MAMQLLPAKLPMRLGAVRRTIRCLLFAQMLLGCASAVQAAADPRLLEVRNLDRRLASISFRLATHNTPLCPQQLTWSGLLLHDFNQYSPSFRAAARETFRLESNYPAVLAIVPGSPADMAGMSEDETIAAINEQSIVPAPVQRRASTQSINAFVSQLQDALQSGPVRLIVRNGAAERNIALPGVPGCASRVELAPGPGLTAAADGETVQISGALAEFVVNDDELAVVAGHEMAHNILRHRERLDAAGVRRGLLASIGKNASRIRATEEEADYLGLYLAARAGYDISAGIGFWERFGRRTSWGIFNSPTHPGWRKRQGQVKAAILEIAAQRASGQALLPEPGRFGR
jgi:beta-barrel assembly-enhancing protease